MTLGPTAMDGVKTQALLLSRRFGSWLTPSDWNRLLAIAGASCGWFWIDNLMPRRWDPAYARSLGYIGKNSQTPFYRSGKWVTAAAASHPLVRAKGGGITSIRIIVPVGHGITPSTSQAFKRIPDAEARLIGKAFRDAVIRVLVGTNARLVRSGVNKGKMRARLTMAQRDQAANARNRGGIDPSTSRAGIHQGMANRMSSMRVRSRFGSDPFAMARATSNGFAGLSDGWTPYDHPAIGRKATQLSANAHYRHSKRGLAMRKMQAARARQRDRQLVHSSLARMEPEDRAARFSTRTLRSHGMA